MSYETSKAGHWCNYVQLDTFPIALHSTLIFKEPKSYKEASNDPLWIEAMKKEIEAFLLTTLGRSLIYPPVKRLIPQSGFSKSSLNLMVHLNGLKQDWSSEVILKKKVLITPTHFLWL